MEFIKENYVQYWRQYLVFLFNKVCLSFMNSFQGHISQIFWTKALHTLEFDIYTWEQFATMKVWKLKFCAGIQNLWPVSYTLKCLSGKGFDKNQPGIYQRMLIWRWWESEGSPHHDIASLDIRLSVGAALNKLSEISQILVFITGSLAWLRVCLG